MALVSLTIAQIKEYVMKLVDKAKREIPKFPKKTAGVEHHCVSELFEKDGEQFIFAFDCTPPYEYGGDKLNKMMVRCVVCSPSKGLETERPVMYEQIETVLDTIDSEELITNYTNVFSDLLKDAEDFDPYERSDFDFDD